jgi:hypothetical protein
MPTKNTSEILLDGMRATLDVWATRFGGKREPLYWLLRLKVAQNGGGIESVLIEIPEEVKGAVTERLREARRYWDNIRYASLDRVTQLWGTIVNSVRVAASSDRATDRQRAVFAFPAESLVSFFRAARERMEVADALYHAFKPMPAPECQALAALLNVHVQAPLDADTLCRLVRLLDAEGPLTEAESADLASLVNTHLVDAAFRGLRSFA